MSTQLEQQSKAVAVCRGLVAEAAQRPEVIAALAAAESIKGRVVTDEASSTEIVDLAATVKAGLKVLETETKRVAEIPAAMTRAIRDTAGPKVAVLKAAQDEAKGAVQRFLDAQERAAREERRKQQELERQRAAEAAAAARENQEDEPPPLSVPEPERPRQVQTAVGSMHRTKTLQVEMVNHHDVDPVYLKLDAAGVKGAFRDALRHEEVQEPGSRDEPVEFGGCRFWYEYGMAQR